MIDWVTFKAPWRHSIPLHSGQVFSVDRDGVHEWTTNKRLAVLGSYESKIQLLSDESTRDPETGDYTHIFIDGNPVKFFQGHNLWGSDDLLGLCVELCLKLSEILNLPIPQQDREQLFKGDFDLKRVDPNIMLDLGNNLSVDAFLYSLEKNAHLRFKGTGIATKGTVYFGKHSRRSSLKFYNKLTELKAKGHTLPTELDQLVSLWSWVTGKLRAEATIRSLQLKDDHLEKAFRWGDNTPLEVVIKYLSRLNMSENHTLTPDKLEGLPPRLVGVYHLWNEGHDLSAMYPKRTFYRYRTQLQELAGIDIAIKQGNRKEPAPNVIDFRRVLTPELVRGVPEWAIGTPLYFEPRRNFA